MKWYNQRAYKQHIKDLKLNKVEDAKKQLCFEFVNSVANTFSREYSRIGVLDVNDLIQYGYCGLLESWEKLDWEMIEAAPAVERQAIIWKFIKNGIKYRIIHGITSDRDTIRIPYSYYVKHSFNKEYKYNIDIFLTRTFSSFFTEEYLDIADDGGNYVADQLNEFLNELMDRILLPLEKIIIKMFYGMDEAYDKPQSFIRISEYCCKSSGNVRKIKQRGMDKLKDKEIIEIIERFIENEVT